jgi:hypothetical protein
MPLDKPGENLRFSQRDRPHPVPLVDLHHPLAAGRREHPHRLQVLQRADRFRAEDADPSRMSPAEQNESPGLEPRLQHGRHPIEHVIQLVERLEEERNPEHIEGIVKLAEAWQHECGAVQRAALEFEQHRRFVALPTARIHQSLHAAGCVRLPVGPHLLQAVVPHRPRGSERCETEGGTGRLRLGQGGG